MSLEMRKRPMSEFSMETVAKTVRTAGYPAYVEQTGGGVATIYAGEPYLDELNDWHYQIVAGPGWFAGESLWTDPRADTDDFSVGLDDYGETPGETVILLCDLSDAVIASRIADRIVEQLNDFTWPAGSHQVIDRNAGYWSFGQMYDREIETAALRRSYAATWPFHEIKEF